jgi:hypothetical protein
MGMLKRLLRPHAVVAEQNRLIDELLGERNELNAALESIVEAIPAALREGDEFPFVESIPAILRRLGEAERSAAVLRDDMKGAADKIGLAIKEFEAAKAMAADLKSKAAEMAAVNASLNARLSAALLDVDRLKIEAAGLRSVVRRVAGLVGAEVERVGSDA